MSRCAMLIGAGLVPALIVLFVALAWAPTTSTSATPGDAIVQDALQRTKSRSGTTQVAVNRGATYQQLSDLGFQLPAAWRSHQFRLIVLRGDFDVSGMAPGFDKAPPARFIAYIYDTANPGIPAMIAPDSNGSVVKRALGDPSLPDPQVVQPTQELHPYSPYEPPRPSTTPTS